MVILNKLVVVVVAILALMFANATTMFGNRKITTKNRDSVLACLRASRAHLN